MRPLETLNIMPRAYLPLVPICPAWESFFLSFTIVGFLSSRSFMRSWSFASSSSSSNCSRPLLCILFSTKCYPCLLLTVPTCMKLKTVLPWAPPHVEPLWPWKVVSRVSSRALLPWKTHLPLTLATVFFHSWRSFASLLLFAGGCDVPIRKSERLVVTSKVSSHIFCYSPGGVEYVGIDWNNCPSLIQQQRWRLIASWRSSWRLHPLITLRTKFRPFVYRKILHSHGVCP
jgi:hypothetical protein